MTDYERFAIVLVDTLFGIHDVGRRIVTNTHEPTSTISWHGTIGKSQIVITLKLTKETSQGNYDELHIHRLLSGAYITFRFGNYCPIVTGRWTNAELAYIAFAGLRAVGFAEPTREREPDV